jgi:hypothetical protein
MHDAKGFRSADLSFQVGTTRSWQLQASNVSHWIAITN